MFSIDSGNRQAAGRGHRRRTPYPPAPVRSAWSRIHQSIRVQLQPWTATSPACQVNRGSGISEDWSADPPSRRLPTELHGRLPGRWTSACRSRHQYVLGPGPVQGSGHAGSSHPGAKTQEQANLDQPFPLPPCRTRAGLSAALGTGATACSRDYTVAYLYAPAHDHRHQRPGRWLPDRLPVRRPHPARELPTPSGGRNPVTLVAAPGGKFIYVTHRDDSNVVEFAVGTDGKLYPQNTYNTIGSFPSPPPSTRPALSVRGLHLPARLHHAMPGPGNITVWTINTERHPRHPSQVNVGNNPTGSAPAVRDRSSTNYIYVTDFDVNTTAPRPQAGLVGTLRGFSHDGQRRPLPPQHRKYPDSALTTLGVLAGVSPSSIVEEQTARFVYVTDRLANQVIGYPVQSGGALVPDDNGPFCHPRAPASTSPSIPAASPLRRQLRRQPRLALRHRHRQGTPAGAHGSGTNLTGTNPTCVTVEPALGIYLYTSNNGDQTLPVSSSIPTTAAQGHPEHALPGVLPADLRRRGRQWLARNSGRQQVAVPPAEQQ